MVERTFPMRLLPGVGICLLIACGCASTRNGPFLGEKIEDPPQLSPYNQPLNSQGAVMPPDQQVTGYRGGFRFPFFGPWNGTTGRPVPPSQSRFHSGGPLGGLPPAAPAVPQSTDPGLPAGNGDPIELGQPTPIESQPTPDSSPSLQAPRTYREEGIPSYPDAAGGEPASGQTIRQRPNPAELMAPTPSEEAPETRTFAPGSQPLDLQVSDPQQAKLAEAARFEVVLRNPFGEAVEDVVIVCRFDEGLSFPEMPEQALRQRLGTLAASESRTLDLSLTAEQVGRHCVDFTLSAAGHEDAAVQRCVQVLDPQTSSVGTSGGVEIELVGPPTRNAGGRMECVLNIHNLTGHEVSGIMATIHHDAALVPQEASAGATRLPGTLSWDLGLLRTDERVQIQVEFACPTPAEHVCVDAEVSGRNLPTQRREVCVIVRPRPTLDVAVADARDPVPVGETTTYLVTVTNRGLAPIRGIRIDVAVDGGLEILSASPQVSEVAMGDTSSPAQREASFAIPEAIPPDQTRTVRIDVRGTAVGTGGLRVQATELATNRIIKVQEPTVINPPLLQFPSPEDIAGSQ